MSKRDIIVFYSKSRNVKPFEGSNECKVSSKKYQELSKIDDFRKILSNFYEGIFVFEELTFKTLEHAFHYKKFKIAGYDNEAYEFSMESGTGLSKGDGALARKHRKKVLLNETQLKPWNKKKWGYLRDMLYAKFSQCGIAKKVLLATEDAELYHFLPRKNKSENLQHWVQLEEIRDILRNKKSI